MRYAPDPPRRASMMSFTPLDDDVRGDGAEMMLMDRDDASGAGWEFQDDAR